MPLDRFPGSFQSEWKRFSAFLSVHTANSVVGYGIHPKGEVFYLPNVDDSHQFRVARENRLEFIGLIMKQIRIVDQCPVIIVDSAIQNLGLHQILKHMTAVAQLRHISGPTVRDFAHSRKTGNTAECYGNAQLWRRSPHTSGCHKKQFFSTAFLKIIDGFRGWNDKILLLVGMPVVQNWIDLDDYIDLSFSGYTHPD